MSANVCISCSSTIQCIAEFQTLLSGLLAVAAAVITAIVIWRSAHLPVERERLKEKRTEDRKKAYTHTLLKSDIRQVSERANQASSTIKVIAASNKEITDNTRKRVIIPLHPIHQDWNFISLLPKNCLLKLTQFNEIVHAHNFDMERAGGSFGDDNFKESIQNRLTKLRTTATELVTLLTQAEDG